MSMGVLLLISTYSELVQDRTGVCFRSKDLERGPNVTSNDDDDRELELGGFPDKGDI